MQISFNFQIPDENDGHVLSNDNPCSSIPEQPEPVFEIKEEEEPVQERSASKRSMRDSETEEAPATKRPRYPKQPSAASSPAAAPPLESSG